MTASRRAGVSLSVNRRLFIGLLPALLAVGLAIGLAYYGEYQRKAPELVVATSALFSLASLALTWRNARHLSARISRLAGLDAAMRPGRDARAPRRGASDELDRIEQTVEALGAALSVANDQRARASRETESRLREQATLLSSTVRAALLDVDDVRLPLHILLDARFGQMNENQEELLGVARDAAEAADVALRRLVEIADADRHALTARREAVQVNDVVRAVLPMVHAAAARKHGRAEAALEPGLPRVPADRVRLAQALALLLETAVERLDSEDVLQVVTARLGRRVTVAIAPVESDGSYLETAPAALARRMIALQGGEVQSGDRSLLIVLGDA